MFIEQNGFRDADSCLAGQEILCVLWNPKAHNHVRKICHWTLS
jgi:hypothetical protein